MLDASLMQLMWLASPALPIGGFSYSEGLEAAVDTGMVSTEEEAAAWLVDQLHLGLAGASCPWWPKLGKPGTHMTRTPSPA